jgi:hypothetical protein
MKNVLLSLLLLWPFFSFGQHPGFSKLYHYSGDTSATPDLINTLLYDSISKKLFFHVTGSARPNTGYRTPSIFFRIDLSGNVEREHLDTLTGGNMLYNSLALSRDGVYLYWGGSRSAQPPGSEPGYYVLTKTDKDLNVIWRRSYSLVNALAGSTLKIITNKNDDNLVLLCNRYADAGNSLGLPLLPNRVYIRKVDSAGNLLEEYKPGPDYYNHPHSFELMDDGTFLVCGRTFSWGQDGTYYTMKVSDTGGEDWHKFYLQEHEIVFPHEMVRSNGIAGEYLIAGEFLPSNSDQGQGFVSKIDHNGNELWSKTPQSGTSFNSMITTIANGYSGGYVAGGSVWDLQRPAPIGWLVRLDTDGNEIWSRSVTAFTRENAHEYIYQVVALPDGGFVAAGSSLGQNVNGIWNQEGWVVRVDSNGCMNPECFGNVLSVKGTHAGTQNFSLYPNPASDYVVIETGIPFSAGTTISLMDNLGRTLQVAAAPTGHGKMRFSLPELASGIYYLQLEQQSLYTRKKLTIVK